MIWAVYLILSLWILAKLFGKNPHVKFYRSISPWDQRQCGKLAVAGSKQQRLAGDLENKSEVPNSSLFSVLSFLIIQSKLDLNVRGMMKNFQDDTKIVCLIDRERRKALDYRLV